MRPVLLAGCALLLAACATRPTSPNADLLPADDAALPDLLLLGEQHDAKGHRPLQLRMIESLAARRRLAALAIEMAEQGHSTTGLGRDASEEAVRQALDWERAGWPWASYSSVIMAAVRAGVPVIGANLPRAGIRETMADARLDGLLPGPALKAQQQAVRTGHCGLLPENQITPMTRVQVARDLSIAQVLAQAAVPGKTVVLVAGAGHVDPSVGVPRHLPRVLRAQAVPLPPEPSDKDPCEELRSQMKAPAPAK
jgi:uncharacterized iron-regulated protein